jgi:hypothetical protein
MFAYQEGEFQMADIAFYIDEILGANSIHSQFHVFNIEIIK